MFWYNKKLIEFDLVQHQISFAGSSDVRFSFSSPNIACPSKIHLMLDFGLIQQVLNYLAPTNSAIMPHLTHYPCLASTFTIMKFHRKRGRPFCSSLVTCHRCSLLVARCSLLVARCSLLVTRYKPTCYFLQSTRYFLQSTLYFLQSTRCFLQSARYFLQFTRCYSFTTYSL